MPKPAERPLRTGDRVRQPKLKRSTVYWVDSVWWTPEGTMVILRLPSGAHTPMIPVEDAKRVTS